MMRTLRTKRDLSFSWRHKEIEEARRARADARIVQHYVHNDSIFAPFGLLHYGLAAPFTNMPHVETAVWCVCGQMWNRNSSKDALKCTREKGSSARLTGDEQFSSRTRGPKLIFSNARVAAGILTGRISNL